MGRRKRLPHQNIATACKQVGAGTGRWGRRFRLPAEVVFLQVPRFRLPIVAGLFRRRAHYFFLVGRFAGGLVREGAGAGAVSGAGGSASVCGGGSTGLHAATGTRKLAIAFHFSPCFLSTRKDLLAASA